MVVVVLAGHGAIDFGLLYDLLSAEGFEQQRFFLVLQPGRYGRILVQAFLQGRLIDEDSRQEVPVDELGNPAAVEGDRADEPIGVIGFGEIQQRYLSAFEAAEDHFLLFGIQQHPPAVGLGHSIDQ